MPASSRAPIELLGDVAVDDEQHRRRDHDGHGAAGGDAAGRDLVVVAVLLELRQGDAPHDGGGRRRGAAGRGEARAADDRRNRQSAGQMPEPLPRRPVDVARDVGVVGEEAHHDEERQHQQVVVGEMAEDGAGRQLCCRIVAAQKPQPEEPAQGGGEGDAHARCQEQRQRKERQCTNTNRIHGARSFLQGHRAGTLNCRYSTAWKPPAAGSLAGKRSGS